MKGNEFLQDAIGLIDDDLVTDVKRTAPKRSTGSWVKWVAVAACITLILGGLTHILLGENGIIPGDNSGTVTIAENLWQQDDFGVFSLYYRSAGVQKLSGDSGSVVFLGETEKDNSSQQTVVEAQTISISQNQTFKFERLIAQRYAVYRSETGFVMFYDTVEDRQIDLQERILGDTGNILKTLKNTACTVVEEKYPGFLSAPVNEQILDLYMTYVANGTLSEHWEEITAIIPDTAFMDALGYEDTAEEEKQSICWNLGWSVFVECLGRMDSAMLEEPYVVTILGIDEVNGICMLITKTLGGSGAQFLVYDVRTDSYRELTGADADLLASAQIDGYSFRFSTDGTIATVAYPSTYLSGGNLLGDLTQRFVLDTYNRWVSDYQGENLGVFFLESGRSFEIWGKGASELYISENNTVMYYKRMDASIAGKSFYASDTVWYNRLKLYNKDTDFWVFQTFSDGYMTGGQIKLQGNFVRFAASETVVIMERGGSYYAYSLTDGSEVTQDIRDGKVSMYAHEQIIVACGDGQLYTTNVFTGQQQVLGSADKYILSNDGAFAFAYCSGDKYVVCYNIASGESCQIAIGSEMSQQLFEREDTILQMSYNEQENTLLLSYYIPEDVTSKYESDVDFYGLLAQLQDDDPDSMYPDYPKVITDLTVTEEVMEQFRNSAYRYDHPDGVISWETYYPEFLTPYQNRSNIFACLGLTEPENYLDVNGTQFILYEDEDETLLLTFWQDWLLFDYQDSDAGFTIEYTVNGRVYDYWFGIEQTQ